MKNRRHFRETINTIILENDIAALAHAAYEGFDGETGLEIATVWLEIFRNEILPKSNPLPLFESIRSITKESLLWLKHEPSACRVLLSDIVFSNDEQKSLCRESGALYSLSKIRFARQFMKNTETIEQISSMGRHNISRILAVPLYRDGQVFGTLAILGDKNAQYDKMTEMLLSYAGILISMLGLES